MRASEAIDQLAAALVKAQAAFPTIIKDKEGRVSGVGKNGQSYDYKYAYADLDACVSGAQPALTANELAVTQLPGFDGTADLLTTRLMHISGQWIEESMRLTKTTTPQAQGSAITYAKRYAYCAVLGLVADTDDDGQTAQHASESGPRARGQGGGESRRQSPPSPAGGTPSRSQNNNERTEYSWINGGKVPTPDASARLASPAQHNRLAAIARGKHIDHKAEIEKLWRGQDPEALDWRQMKWLAEALEDGWTPEDNAVDQAFPGAEAFADTSEPF